MTNKFFITVFIFSIFTILSAQNAARVEKFIINGELKANDPISAELGKINAIQLNFSKGDRFYSHLEAEFVPMLVLVPPSGEYIVKYPDVETLSAVFDDKINESGQWLLYIVGDSLDTGEYTLTNKYASAEAMQFSAKDFCGVINYLMLHLKSDFHFIKGKEIDEEVEWNSKITFPNSINSRISGIDNSMYKSLLFEGKLKETAADKFNSINLALKNCLPDFNIDEKNWKSIMGAEGKREKSITFWSIWEPSHFLKLSIFENPSEVDSEKIYSVEVLINKTE